MTIEDLQNICKKLPYATEDVKWENHLCFCIGKKMFLILGLDNFPVNASFKVTGEEFEEMSARSGFKPAEYLARYKWIGVTDINLMGRKEWIHYIHQSYCLVKNKLPNKIKKQFSNYQINETGCM